MNFLAHLYLSCEDEDLLIGNMIADFIRNKDIAAYSDSIQKGIYLHRQIDTYTDNHPIIRQGTRRLQENHGKYAAVIIDILYDHLLANHWDRYSGQTLEVFAKNCYGILSRRMEELPAKLQRQMPGMIEADWLVKYRSLDGLQFTMERMDLRTKFPSTFTDSVADYLQAKDAFNEEFHLFFPDVIQFVEQQCSC